MWKLTLIISCFVCLLFAQPVLTAAPENIPCPVPTIHYPADAEPQKPFVLLAELNCPDEIVFRGRRIKIYDKKRLTYNWKLSAGEIIEGQGTAQIRVDATRVKAEEITATLEVGGFAPECGNQATRSIKFGPEGNSQETSDKP